MNYFNINNIPEVNLDSISIIHNGSTLNMKWNDKLWMLEDETRYIEKYAYSLIPLDSDNPISVLLGGLGMGTIAEYLIANKNITKLDALESNLDLTNWTVNSGHLNPLINIIEADATSYTPTQRYDLIIMDLWFPREDRISSEVPNMRDKYIPHLNSGGTLYIPIDTYLHTID